MSESTPNAFAKTELNYGKRKPQRLQYDKDKIASIVNATPLMHVSFNAPVSDPSLAGFPTILPMLGAMGTFPPQDTHQPPGSFTSSEDPTPTPAIYLHGSSASRLTKLTQDHPDGLPICVSATVLDGYVLALAPFNHSCNYRSAICFGRAKMLTSEPEILYAMELITDRLIPDRWTNSRSVPTKSEITATGILKVEIESASAKVRCAGPSDDRKDLKDEELRGRTWTGVVPAWEQLGEPIADEGNLVEKVPGYIDGWVRQENAKRKARAELLEEP